MGAPIHLATANIGTNTPLPVDQPIELAFDRLLLPITVTRQSIVLVDKAAPSTAITFAIAYDPVARVVTLTPVQTLSPGHTYQLSIASPSDPTVSSGLHAIDGATMDPNSARTITFLAETASGTPPVTCSGIVGPCMSFCNDIVPILSPTCAGSSICHNGTIYANGGPIAAGLALTGPRSPELASGNLPAIPSMSQFIYATAINRLSIESAQGALTQPGPPSPNFGQDMPLIDTTTVPDPNTLDPIGPAGSGDPGNSFLIYKVLMAGTGGALPTGANPLPNVYSVPWVPLSADERTTLASIIPGREMPLPTDLDNPPNPSGLPVDSLERLSLWMAQGASTSSCP